MYSLLLGKGKTEYIQGQYFSIDSALENYKIIQTFFGKNYYDWAQILETDTGKLVWKSQ